MCFKDSVDYLVRLEPTPLSLLLHQIKNAIWLQLGVWSRMARIQRWALEARFDKALVFKHGSLPIQKLFWGIFANDEAVLAVGTHKPLLLTPQVSDLRQILHQCYTVTLPDLNENQVCRDVHICPRAKAPERCHVPSRPLR